MRKLSTNQRMAMRATLIELQGGKCCYCGHSVRIAFPVEHYSATLEHLRRKKDGGTDHRDNLAVACHRCNSSRGDMSWVEFKTLMSAGAVA